MSIVLWLIIIISYFIFLIYIILWYMHMMYFIFIVYIACIHIFTYIYLYTHILIALAHYFIYWVFHANMKKISYFISGVEKRNKYVFVRWNVFVSYSKSRKVSFFFHISYHHFLGMIVFSYFILYISFGMILLSWFIHVCPE